MICPECNNTVPDGSKFCNHCGHKFEQENTIKCPNLECGHLIPVDSKFCPDCGCKTNTNQGNDWQYYFPFPQGEDIHGCPLYGYKDIRTGNVVITPQYNYAYRFYEGIAAVGIVPSRGKGCSRKGYINVEGIEIIPMKYSSANRFSEERAWVEHNGEWQCIDNNGKHLFVFPLGYLDRTEWKIERPQHFLNGISYAQIVNKRYKDENHTVSINRTGEIISYDDVNKILWLENREESANAKVFEAMGSFGIRDNHDNILVQAKFDNITHEGGGFFVVQKGEQYGVYFEDGKEIVSCTHNELPVVCDDIGEVAFLEEDVIFNYWGRIER